ncbi:MAG: ferric reductase-like transmembrane domain-containing protein [Phycisphaerales bacterium]|nr:ferric reductase-like transmembrane domain-containing protein [Phycisphaerales bacterium]
MSVGYVAIQWSRHKRIYDAAAAVGAVLFVGAWVITGKLMWRGEHALSDEVLILRGLGSCAIVLLHVILAIGPLARLDRRFLPVLYNRRHLGVMTFLIGLAHAALAVGYYHGFGVVSPLVSLLTSNTNVASLREFPFEWLGVGALAILFLMAATSHDFWLRNLGARAWKRLHMLVYIAYGLLVGHVALGAVQTDRGGAYVWAVGVGMVVLTALHVAAAWREAPIDAGRASATPNEAWLDVGSIDEIPMDRARLVAAAGGERIAVFRHKDGFSAVTNVCAHQGGPLGEGKVIDGCITCPWHGWQYKPGDGCSPPPFTEKIATYQVRVIGGRVQVDPKANPAGTPVTPATPMGGEGGHA